MRRDTAMNDPRPAVEFLPSIRHHPYVQELEARLKAACEPCAECGHVDYRELDDILWPSGEKKPHNKEQR